MRPTARSRVLAVLGDPVGHSLSPVMHNAAIAALGLDAVYVALHVSAEHVADLVRVLGASGVAGNVTVPHKRAVAGVVSQLTAAARDAGAVNTFWTEGGALVGDNTDVAGILEALEVLEADEPWLVLGTGGAARAVAVAARERGAHLVVRSRSEARARAFVEWARSSGNGRVEVDDGQPVRTAINATPLGLGAGDAPPVERRRLEPCRVALDLVYAPGETRWVRECRARGINASDGRRVLVAQGARSLERFFPGSSAPRQVMAQAVERALAP